MAATRTPARLAVIFLSPRAHHSLGHADCGRSGIRQGVELMKRTFFATALATALFTALPLAYAQTSAPAGSTPAPGTTTVPSVGVVSPMTGTTGAAPLGPGG